MSKQKELLGKGIRALLTNIEEDTNITGKKEIVQTIGTSTGGINFIPLSQIEVNPFQPRVSFDEDSLSELADSIKIHGVIQPISVRRLSVDKYQLIAGERRLRASKLAGKEDIPAFIRTANDQESLEIALIENIQREDLNAIEIGVNYKRLIDECSLSQEGLAERVGKKRSTITNYLRLLKLPPDIQLAVKNDEISMGHAKALVNLEDVDAQLSVYKDIVTKGLSVRQTENLAKILPKSKSIKKKASAKTLPYILQKVQDHLTSHLSTKVELTAIKNGKGQISIAYYNDGDLERLLDLITN
ncbi:MAG: ParB/RepB/Spo0J family partition protein [Bacteroidota bacterium]